MLERVRTIKTEEYGELPLVDMRPISPQEERERYLPVLLRLYEEETGTDPESPGEAWAWYEDFKEEHGMNEEQPCGTDFLLVRHPDGRAELVAV